MTQIVTKWVRTSCGLEVLERKDVDIAAMMWEEFDAKARSAEPPYEKAALAQFESEAVAVVKIIESAVPNFKADSDPSFLAALIWPYIEAAELKIAAAYAIGGLLYRQWYNRFRPLVAKTMASQGPKDPAPSVRIGILGPTSPQMLAAINRRVTKLSGAVTETTRQQIRDVIAQARRDGVGVSQLAARIRTDVFGDTISKARSTTIARTETVGALNEGAMLKAKQGGIFRAKQWVSQRDGRVRDSHRTAEGEGWIPIDQLYSNGLEYPHAPGSPAAEVINCRCSQMFSDLTADEANRSG
jgi:hypothetical protein